MSEKITGYPNAATSIVAGSFLDISEEIAPLVYESKKLPTQLLLDLGENIYNIDGTLDSDRLLQGDNNAFGLGLTKLKHFQLDAIEVSIASSGVDKNVTVITPNTGALIIPSSADPDVQITAPVEFMLKGDSTDNDIRAYIGGAWVSLLGGGNTLYSGDDNLAGDRTVGMAAFKLSFSGTGKMFVGSEVGTAKFNVDNGTGTGFTTSFSRDFDAGVGLNGHLFTVNPRGSEVRKVRTNGTAFSIFNEWTIGSSRKSFDFIASVNNNYFSIYDSNNGTTETTRISDKSSWWIPRTASFGFAFGHSTPLLSTVHLKTMDLRVEGASDTNLLNIDQSTNQLSIGSTPFANVKASITNSEAVTYSFLVLNQATTSEFSVRETGEVRISGGQLSIGSNLIGTEKAIIGGQTIIDASPLADQFYFTGDGSSSKGFSAGQTIARNNHFYMENTSGTEFAYIGANGDSFLNATESGATFIIGASSTISSGAKLQVDVKVGDGAIPSALFSNDNNNKVVLNTTNNNSGFGTETPDASAALDVTSTEGGILIPRMTGAQADAIGSPANGLILYITLINVTFSSVGFWKRDNGAWVQF